MKFREYQLETVRTLPDLSLIPIPAIVLNSVHMTMGLASELEEIQDAYRKGDKVNLMEELCDYEWYASNYMNIHNISCPDNLLGWANKFVRYDFNYLVKLTSKLVDIDKKAFAYGLPYNEDINRAKSTLIVEALATIEMLAKAEGINMDDARAKNINKLRVRYPEKFDSELAINRNLEKERKELEND